MTTRTIPTSLGAALTLALCGCTPQLPDRDTATAASTARTFTPHGAARTALEHLPVKSRAAKTGYDRTGRFGTAWSDDTTAPGSHDSCDTRNNVLLRDLTRVRLRSASRCTVAAGLLHDPYTGTDIAFVRGPRTSLAVQVDHVVALSDAWQTGAQQLTQQQREAFANDPLALVAASGPANTQKSDGDAATWLPANKPFRCTYVARQIAVKAKYRLWITPAEKSAMTQVLNTCPAQELPGDDTQGVVLKAEK